MWSTTPQPRRLQENSSSSGESSDGSNNGSAMNGKRDYVLPTSIALATPFHGSTAKVLTTPGTALTMSSTPPMSEASSQPISALQIAPTPNGLLTTQRRTARTSTKDIFEVEVMDSSLGHLPRRENRSHQQRRDGSTGHPTTGRVLFSDDGSASSESLDNAPSPRRSDSAMLRRPKSSKFYEGDADFGPRQHRNSYSHSHRPPRRRKPSLSSSGTHKKDRFNASSPSKDLSPAPSLVDEGTWPISSSSSTDIRSWSSSEQSSPERNDRRISLSPSKNRRLSRFSSASRRSRSNSSFGAPEMPIEDDLRRSGRSRLRMSSASSLAISSKPTFSSMRSLPSDFSEVKVMSPVGRLQATSQLGARPLSPTVASPPPSPSSSSLVRISIKTVWKAGAALVLVLSATLFCVNVQLHGTVISKPIVGSDMPLPHDPAGKFTRASKEPRNLNLGKGAVGGGLRGIHPNVWNVVKRKKFPVKSKAERRPAQGKTDETPFPLTDRRMYGERQDGPASSESTAPRIFYFDSPTDSSHPVTRKVQLFPAEFSDNTQYYSLFDSSDERLNRMEIREPYDGECVPMKEWQTTFNPSCNGMHELDLANHQNKKEGGALQLFGTKGFWRNAWKLDTLGAVETIDHNGPIPYMNETVVLKTLKYEHNFEDAHFEHDRIDAIAMERLTASPHVINIYGFCGHSVITEHADGPRVGTLADKSKKTPLKRLEIARDIASGLADVHGIDGDGNSTFVHLDVNPANVVSVGGTLKLNDFNIGIIRRWNTTSNKQCGFPAQYPNPQWRSPEEANESQALTEKVDVFSMGHIFFRLICGHEPWNKLEKGGRPSKEEVTEKVKRGILPHIPEEIMKTSDPEVKAIRDAMLQCYKVDPEKRPSARSVAKTLNKHLKRLKEKSKRKR